MEPNKHEYNGEDITITLPGASTVYNIEWLSMWCVQSKVEFGHVDIPNSNDLYVPPYFWERAGGVSSIFFMLGSCLFGGYYTATKFNIKTEKFSFSALKIYCAFSLAGFATSDN